MKQYIFLVLIFLSISHFANAQEASIEKGVTDFFEAFHQKDTLKMRKMFAENARFISISTDDDATDAEELTLDEMLISIAKIPNQVKFEERIKNLQIQSDSLFAHAWMQYELYVNGTLSHHGINSFQWVFHNGSWKIISISDTRLKP
uniref:nuclear transport factor 2 family protein n=1 Tax=Flavobacterium sp. TaxID=239 RepID=UPI00404989C0